MYDPMSVARHEVVSRSYSVSTEISTTHAGLSSLIGIVTAIIGNVIISFALNTQRYAHIRIDRDFHDDLREKDARKRVPKKSRGYGTVAQQEQVAEERARLNAEAPGPGNDEMNGTNAFGQTQLRKPSASSDETARPQGKDDEGQEARKSYLKSSIWWLGIILMAVGETGNFLAYGFAPASIVGPLGVVGIICNCLIAPLMLKERFRQRDFWGVLIAIGGVVTVVLSAKQNETRMGPNDLFNNIKRWEFLTYIGITCTLIVILMWASPRYGKRTIWLDLSLVGLFGGYTALSTKGIASMLSASLWLALTFPITYVLLLVLIASAIMQIRYLNRALSNFDSTQVIPIQFVLFTLSVIIGSAVLYRDFEKTDSDHAIKFVIGCLLTFFGAWLITSGRKHGDDHDEEQQADQTIHLIDEEAEPEDERTPLKQEQFGDDTTDFDASKTKQKRPSESLDSGKASRSPSVPSVSITTPREVDLSNNPWVSSVENRDDLERPRTPSNAREIVHIENTPFFTPGSLPNTITEGRVGLRGRTDSSPADPQTPTRASRAESPPKADIPVLGPGEAYQTPPPGLFRSARGSMSRLLPGPFLGPLSSSSLSAVVAQSLRQGEGSPQGPIRSRSYRKQRPPHATRAERNRRSSATAALGFDGLDLEDGLPTPALSRWQTRESLPLGRERSTTDDFGTAESSTAATSNRPRLLPSFSTSVTRLFSRVTDRGKDPERDELDAGPSTQRRRKS